MHLEQFSRRAERRLILILKVWVSCDRFKYCGETKKGNIRSLSESSHQYIHFVEKGYALHEMGGGDVIWKTAT